MKLKNETSMKAIQTIFCVLILLISSVWSFGQSDEVIAGFTYPDVKATINPEFPAFCNTDIGVKVTCNEDFIHYKWKKGEQILLQGTKADSEHIHTSSKRCLK